MNRTDLPKTLTINLSNRMTIEFARDGFETEDVIYRLGNPLTLEEVNELVASSDSSDNKLRIPQLATPIVTKDQGDRIARLVKDAAIRFGSTIPVPEDQWSIQFYMLNSNSVQDYVRLAVVVRPETKNMGPLG